LDESVPPLLPEPVEGLSALAFIAVAVIGLVRAGALLANVFPLGSAGSLLSGGTLPVLNAVVAVEVAAGIFVVVREELTQAVQIRDRWMVEE